MVKRIRPKRGRLVLVAVGVVLTGVIGIALLMHSTAATPFLSLEVESGNRSGSVVTGDTAGASGNASVKFGAAPAAGAIIFEDDFNGPAGSTYDHSKWGDYSSCAYNSSAAYGNIKCGDNETLDGQGHLVIPATPTAGSSIMTGDKFRFNYGTMSAWIKAPPQVGYWPAFWTLNSEARGPSTLPVGEIDTLEGYTTWNNVYHAGGHNWTGNGATESHSADNYCPNNWQTAGRDLSSAYNKYSAKVEPNRITYYFNDVQCGQAFVPVAGKPWAFGPNVMRGNWLILTLAIGGAGGQQQPATQPAQMLVDRVEVRNN